MNRKGRRKTLKTLLKNLVPCIICHMSCATCHASCVMCHVSGVRCHVSWVICHGSCVMCSVKHVACHQTRPDQKFPLHSVKNQGDSKTNQEEWDKQTDKQTDIATYRLNRPRGQFNENYPRVSKSRRAPVIYTTQLIPPWELRIKRQRFNNCMKRCIVIRK